MSELNQIIKEHVDTIADEINHACGYQLNEPQKDELRLTGCVAISLHNLASHFNSLNEFYKTNHTNWTLSLNTISGAFEIALKGCHLFF